MNDQQEIRKRLTAYGQRNKYSAFGKLRTRAHLPYSVYQYLKEAHGMTGMVQFLSDSTALKIVAGMKKGHYQEKVMDKGLVVLHRARKEVLGSDYSDNEYYRSVVDTALHRFGHFDRYHENKEKNMEIDDYENAVNADRNEMAALLVHSKGGQFVSVTQQHSKLNGANDVDGPTYLYKSIDLDLKEGDTVVVQWRDRLGLATVKEVLSEPPTSDDYDYTKKIRHVVQKVDVERSEALKELDTSIVKRITASETKDRMERLARTLGAAIDDIDLKLTK